MEFLNIMSNKPTIHLALGGGGARGLAHIGALKVLEANNIRPSLITGCSIGAVIGAYYALGGDISELEKKINSLSKRQMLKLLDMGKLSRSLLAGKKVRDFISAYLGDKDFKDTDIPLRIVATNLGTGQETWFSKGSIVSAAQASISVPGIFPPVEIDGNYFVDGGITNPTPIDEAAKGRPDLVIGVDLMVRRGFAIKNPTFLTTLMQSYEIIRTQSIVYKMQKHLKNTVLIKPESRATIDSFKFYDINKFIQAGEVAAQKALPEILKKLK